MSALRTPPATDATPAPPLPPLTRPLVGLLAAGAGLTVASLYYSQPMLGILGTDVAASPKAIGLVPTLTQLGYALGIFFLAPLGDRFDRRRIILIKAVALCLALLAGAASSSIGLLLAASLAVGLAATVAQDIVPAAATLAPEAQRGKIVGTVMTGLLLGILLSRVISGFVAARPTARLATSSRPIADDAPAASSATHSAAALMRMMRRRSKRSPSGARKKMPAA